MVHRWCTDDIVQILPDYSEKADKGNLHFCLPVSMDLASVIVFFTLILVLLAILLMRNLALIHFGIIK